MPGLRLAVNLVLAASLAACSQAGNTHHGAHASNPSGDNISRTGAPPSGNGRLGVDDARNLQLPLDAYSLDERQVDQIQLAAFVEMGMCVRKAGFSFDATALATYWKQYVDRDIANVGLYQNLRRYSVTDQAIAAKYGYHMNSTVDHPNMPVYTVKTQMPGFGQITKSELYVLAAGPNSCANKAYAKINGKSSTRDPAGHIAADSYSRSKTAAPVAAAFKEWSSCMIGRGYHYPDPTKAGTNFDISTPTVSAQEKAVAIADVACKKQTNLIAIWFGWEAGYQRQQIEKNAQALHAEKQAHDAQLRRAAAVIGSSGH